MFSASLHGKCCTAAPPWWRHQIETFSALLAICAGNSPVPVEFPAQRPVTRSFDVFFDLRLNKRLSKQSWGWWFEALSRPLWRHRNAHCKIICDCDASKIVENWSNVLPANKKHYQINASHNPIKLGLYIYDTEIQISITKFIQNVYLGNLQRHICIYIHIYLINFTAMILNMSPMPCITLFASGYPVPMYPVTIDKQTGVASYLPHNSSTLISTTPLCLDTKQHWALEMPRKRKNYKCYVQR